MSDNTDQTQQTELDVEHADAAPADAAALGRVEHIIEALLLASDTPLSIEQLHRQLGAALGVSKSDIRSALEQLGTRVSVGAIELKEVSSGFRIQVKSDYAEWVGRLWQEKPPRYSRALLETLALVCYRQPITRGEIEDIRGVAVSTNILRTLSERGWIRELGVKEVPGRPMLFGTTQHFLDDFNLRSLDELPSLPEIKDADQLDAALARLEQASGGAAPEIDEESDEAVSVELSQDADENYDDEDTEMRDAPSDASSRLH